MLTGAEKSSDPRAAKQRIAALTAVAEVLSIPADAAERYATIRTELEKSGKLIGPNDLWIAAHAIALKLTLVSNNEREFRRVRGLKLVNWAT